MAYATPLGASCSEDGCDRPSTYVVKNWHNEVVRDCCRDHAWTLVHSLSAVEEAEGFASEGGSHIPPSSP